MPHLIYSKWKFVTLSKSPFFQIFQHLALKLTVCRVLWVLKYNLSLKILTIAHNIYQVSYVVFFPPFSLNPSFDDSFAMTLTQHRRSLPRLPLVLYSQLVEYFRQKLVRLLMSYRALQTKEEGACKVCTESRHVCFKRFSTPVLTLLIPGCNAHRGSGEINGINAHAHWKTFSPIFRDSRDNNSHENTFPKFMNLVRHGLKARRLHRCRARVV